MKNYTIDFKKISKSEEINMRKIVSKYKGFGEIKDENLNKISNKLNLDKKLVLSFRSQYLKNKVIRNSYIIKKDIIKISSEYSKNNILDLSLKYDVSPMTIFRSVIKHKYPDIVSLKKSIHLLNDYDRNQLNLAEKNDIVAPLNQDNSKKKADEYEEKIGKFLKKKNISFKTEVETAEEQKRQYGIVKATPDFLLDKPIIINNKIVNWIEVKNFYGTNINFLFNKIRKQTEKYYKKWGSGCLVYRYGVYQELKLKHVCIICF